MATWPCSRLNSHLPHQLHCCLQGLPSDSLLVYTPVTECQTGSCAVRDQPLAAKQWAARSLAKAQMVLDSSWGLQSLMRCTRAAARMAISSGRGSDSSVAKDHTRLAYSRCR